MEIHEIRYFLALAETLNFTSAAKRCNVTQPSLTRAIKNLENKLDGGPLIHRERGNSHLTELGRIMKPYFESLLTELEAAKSRAKNYARIGGTSLRIGLMCTIGPRLLIEFFARFSEQNLGVDVNLVDGPVPTIEKQLEEGELDVAVYARPEALDAGFHAIPLYEERFMVAVARSDPIAKLNAVCMRDLNQKHYLGRSTCEYYDHLRRIRLEMGGIEFKRRYTSDRDDWVQCMVMAGLGFTYIPEYTVAVPGLVTLPLIDPEVRRVVQLVTVRGRPHSPAVGAFVRDARRFPWAGKATAVRSAGFGSKLA